MEFQDYYATLGVPRTASPAEIKKAFRKHARENHPDTHPGDAAAERRFKAANEANEVLSDPKKRELYDTLGKDWEAYARAGAKPGAGGTAGTDPFGPGGPFAGFGGGAAGSGRVRYEFHTSADAGGFSDFFNAFFGGGDASGGRRSSRTQASGGGPTFDEILAGMGIEGDGRTTRGRPEAALPTYEAEAEVTLEEAFHGTARRVEVDGRRLEVTIPKGVSTGSRVKLTGKGPGGADLVVVVRVAPHPVFTRHGRDLERELPLTLEEALLGAKVHVGTLKGQVLLTIAPGTQSGKRIRLAGQGMPALRGDGRGDLYARARVVLPTDLSDEAEAAARTFLDLVHQPDPRQPDATASQTRTRSAR